MAPVLESLGASYLVSTIIYLADFLHGILIICGGNVSLVELSV